MRNINRNINVNRIIRVLVLGVMLGLGYNAFAEDLNNFDKLDYTNPEVVESKPFNTKHGENGMFNFRYEEDNTDCIITSVKIFKELQSLKKAGKLDTGKTSLTPRTNGFRLELVEKNSFNKIMFYQDYNDCVTDNQHLIEAAYEDVPVGRKHLGGKNNIEWGKGN